jgi:hypothetical protein
MVLPGIDQDHLAGAQQVNHAVHPESGGGGAAMEDDLMFAVDVTDQPAGHRGEKDPARTPLQEDRPAQARIDCVHSIGLDF